MAEPEQRLSFEYQLAQFLLIDLGHPMTADSINAITRAVQNVLAVAHSIPGKIRIPAFGVAIINRNFNFIHPLDSIRGNLTKLMKSLEMLCLQEDIGVKVSLQEYKNLLNTSMQALAENTVSTTPTSHNGSKLPGRIQLTFVTGKNGSLIQNILLEVINLSLTPTIRRVRIVEMQGENSLGSSGLSNQVESYITCTSTTGTDYELDSIFKIWLTENEGEKEHLRINLGNDLTIKCDMDECNINPEQLPFGHRFHIYNDTTAIFCRGKVGMALSNDEVPVFDFQVVSKLALSGLCPSFIFGNPKRIYATKCWRLSWNESQVNQKLFIALCQHLIASEYGLLISLRNQSKLNEMITYYFVTSDGEKLMLNCVAPFEIRYPERKCSTETEQDAILLINQALSHLPTAVEYSPEDFPSKLYGNLSRHLKNTSGIKGSAFNYSSRGKTSTKPYQVRKSDSFQSIQKKTEATSVPKRKRSMKKPEEKKVHPALLSPESKAKIRNPNLGPYELKEELLDDEEMELL